MERLLAYSKPLDQVLIPPEIRTSKIIQEPSSLPDQFQEAAPRVVILDVNLEMTGKVLDPLAEQRNLHFRRARVRRMSSELLDRLLFLRFSDPHVSASFLSFL